MKIAIACDHAGYEYKEKLVAFLRQKGYEVKDFGTHSAESMDYPDTAHPMAAAVESGSILLWCLPPSNSVDRKRSTIS